MRQYLPQQQGPSIPSGMQKLAGILPILAQLQGLDTNEQQNAGLRQKLQQSGEMFPLEKDRLGAETRGINARSEGLEFENQHADEMLKAKLMESLMSGVGSFGQGLAMTQPPEEASRAFRQFAMGRGLMADDPEAHIRQIANEMFGGDIERAKQEIARFNKGKQQ